MVASYTKCKDTVTSIVGKNIFLLLPRTTIFQIQAKTINFFKQIQTFKYFSYFSYLSEKKRREPGFQVPTFFLDYGSQQQQRLPAQTNGYFIVLRISVALAP